VDLIVMNDADAAGLAEMEFGVGKGRNGTVILLTLGTGIGSAIFLDGKLLPNSELGHLHYKKGVTEHYASNKARVSNELSWEKWGRELNQVLLYIYDLLSPDLIIIGGGVSKRFGQYKHYLTTEIEILPAKLLNNAGIIGAACRAAGKL
ncbi:MAG: ROK family protein, partial [Melioribacteraceae bacterium]|nr:ROK family protein [Melioribacteraceae bacterium]